MENKPTRSRPAAGTICLALLLPLIATAAPQYQTPAPAPGSETPPPSLKKALAAGQTLIGVTITAANLDAAVNLANAGFDFLWIEMEHSPLTLESLRAIVLGTRGSRAIPITRVPVNEPWLAKRVLDVGSLGVIFPFTSTRELAEQAVRSCKYPPLGTRGYGPTLAASRWGLSAADYVTFANEHVLVVTIIEQKAGGRQHRRDRVGRGNRRPLRRPERPVVLAGRRREARSSPRRGSGRQGTRGRTQIRRACRVFDRRPRADQQADRAGLPVLSGLERLGAAVGRRSQPPLQDRAPRSRQGAVEVTETPGDR